MEITTGTNIQRLNEALLRGYWSMELKQLPWSPLEHIGKTYFPPYKLMV